MSRYTDYGAGRGGVVKNQKNASVGVCSSCGKRTILSKSAWFRKSRPLCPACGGFLDPSEGLQEEDGKFAVRDRRPSLPPRCCICRSEDKKASIEDGLPVCSDEVCHKVIELLHEKLCAPGDIAINGGLLHHFEKGRCVFCSLARSRPGGDFEPVRIDFEA